MIKHYSLDAVNALTQRYVDKGGLITTLEEGTLGWGLTMCYGLDLKTAIIQERFLNEWSSTHTVRFYNKTPKKYIEMLKRVEELE